MRLSAEQSSNLSAIEAELQLFAPIFHNYRNGVVAVRVTADVSTVRVDGFELISCNPFNGGFVAKYRKI